MKFIILASIIFSGIVPLISYAEEVPLPNALRYQAGETIKILIIPGHDKKYSGTYFNGISEQAVNLKLANAIRDELMRDPQLAVTVTRDENGYIPVIQKYFDENETKINRFIDSHKKETKRLLDDETGIAEQVPHHDAAPVVAYQLYGVNKWAAENDFDIILNVHFNDDTGHTQKIPGKYAGFTVYVPDEHLPNHDDAVIIGEAIGARMRQTFPTSTMPLESTKDDENGVIPDFNLIALGSNGTLDIPSVLIEYSYIYEPQVNPAVFDLSAFVMARATTRGVYDYLNGRQDLKNLLYSWGKTPIGKSLSNDVMALQYGLREIGFYPPKTMADCPFTGNFGPCTLAAVKDFQKAHNLKPDGVVGAKTKEILNSIFSSGI
jgi:N-acetylmuramoyl-L-alanine amidase